MNDSASITGRVSTPASGDARRRDRRNTIAAWATLLLASGVLGYQVGSDLAERENRRDCVAAGRADCR